MTNALTVKEAIRISRTYAVGSSSYRLLTAFWVEVNTTLETMGKPEATFADIVRLYEDDCSILQAAYEIADPIWGYDAYLADMADARQSARSCAGALSAA